MFNSPDGMMFDNAGIHWIQTYGDDSNEGQFEGHGQHPDAGRRPGGSPRFHDRSADRRTMFVGIQHPHCAVPGWQRTLSRSTVISVWREDGRPGRLKRHTGRGSESLSHDPCGRNAPDFRQSGTNPAPAFEGPNRPSGQASIRVLGPPEPWQTISVLPPVHGREHIAQIRDMRGLLDDLGQVLGAHE